MVKGRVQPGRAELQEVGPVKDLWILSKIIPNLSSVPSPTQSSILRFDP